MTHGRAKLTNGSGNIEVGISEGTAASIDVNSERGAVHNFVSVAGKPWPVGRQGHRSTPARGTATSSFNAPQADRHEASVTSTSSDQLVCVPSCVTSANRASPR